tara:strand:- start:59 stop:172 length:114 start_codon:yes stop_codon:yes gene_type:complete
MHGAGDLLVLRLEDGIIEPFHKKTGNACGENKGGLKH